MIYLWYRDRGVVILMHPYDKARMYYQRRRIMDPRNILLDSSKRSARMRGIPHELTLKDIIIPTHCKYLGHKLIKYGTFPDSMSIDRICSDVGYIPGNIQIISREANHLKSDMSEEDFLSFLEFYKAENLYEETMAA